MPKMLKTVGTDPITKKFIVNTNSPTVTVDYTYYNSPTHQTDNEAFFSINIYNEAGAAICAQQEQGQQSGVSFNMSKTFSKTDGSNFNAGEIIQVRFLVYQAEPDFYAIYLSKLSVHV